MEVGLKGGMKEEEEEGHTEKRRAGLSWFEPEKQWTDRSSLKEQDQDL